MISSELADQGIYIKWARAAWPFRNLESGEKWDAGDPDLATCCPPDAESAKADGFKARFHRAVFCPAFVKAFNSSLEAGEGPDELTRMSRIFLTEVQSGIALQDIPPWATEEAVVAPVLSVVKAFVALWVPIPLLFSAGLEDVQKLMPPPGKRTTLIRRPATTVGMKMQMRSS